MKRFTLPRQDNILDAAKGCIIFARLDMVTISIYGRDNTAFIVIFKDEKLRKLF